MASGDALRSIRNAAYRLTFPLRDTSGQLVSSATSPAPLVSLDSAAYGAPAGSVTEIGSSGIYTVDLTAAELTAAANATFTCSSGTANTYYTAFPFEGCFESGVAQASTSTSITLRSAASSTNDFYNGSQIEIVRGTGAGQWRTIYDYVGATTIATVDRAWITNPDTTSVYKVMDIGIRHGTDIYAVVNTDQIDGDATAAANSASFSTGNVIVTSVNDASPTTTSWVGAAGLSATDDFYNDMICVFTSGTLAALTRQVTDYTGGTLTFTVNAFPSAPANGDAFVLFGRVF